MFVNFFLELRQAKVPVSLREYLTLMEAMRAGLAAYKVEDFYYLSRSALVKDERNLDKFDKVFGHVFKGLEAPAGEGATAEIPEEWLRKLAEKLLTDEEKAQIEAIREQVQSDERLSPADKESLLNELNQTLAGLKNAESREQAVAALSSMARSIQTLPSSRPTSLPPPGQPG